VQAVSKIAFDRVVIDGNGIIFELRSGNLFAQRSTLSSVIISDVTGKRIGDICPIAAEMMRLIGRHVSELIEAKPKASETNGASPKFRSLAAACTQLKHAQDACDKAAPWEGQPDYTVPLGTMTYNTALGYKQRVMADIETFAKDWLRSIGVRTEP
jgi:hypothetical protein